MTLQTKPLDNVGVEVLGFNINQPYTDALKEELRTLFYEHGIVVFRNQDITPENQIRFSAVFGPLE
ncbi:MAG: TauD/TfdA family dioxygenase, partial [Pseudomonadales bacterium]|nr:TauD/TfdA family dioxygenase [Pseudomonadales bacterium]